MSTRILLVDDHRMFREGMKVLLQEESDLQVVGEAATGWEAVEQAAELQPHLILMDVTMPELNGIEATRTILEAQDTVRIIGLSAHANEDYVREMFAHGASGYVLKSRGIDDLLRAIREVMQDRKYLSPDIARTVLDAYVELTDGVAEDPAFVLLTNREREVLQQVAEGTSTKEIADRLGVSDKTVETHRSNLMEKLQLHSVAELTKYAVRHGLTTLDQ